MQPGRARTNSLGVPLLPLARWVGWVAPVCPTHGVLVLSCPSAALRVCGVLGLPAPVHRCALSVCCVGCAVSWASRLLFTGVPARCVVLRVRCPGPPGSCSPVCPLGLLFCVCGVLGLPAPVHRCARSVCCVACAASRASRLLFTGVPARCVVLRVRCPGPPGSCSPVCPLGVLFCVCGVLGLPAPVHRCARSVCCVACAVSWATRLLFTGVPARCVVLRVRCPGPPGSCSPVCPLGVLFCVCGVLGLPAPVHRCARSVCCVACAASWASRLLFTGVPARCVVLLVRCPGPPGSCSPVCPLGVLFCVCGVLGLPAPVHRCTRSVCCVACAVSWASRLLFTGVPLGVSCCVCGVLGLPAPVHLCARSVCCFVCAASWASRLLFTGAPARCVVLRVRWPGPPGSCSPVRPLGVLCCVCGVLGLPAPVHLCARSVCCFACAASWASRLLFTGVPARCVVLCVRRPGPPGSCSPVCPLGVLFCVCGVLGLLAPVHRCARSVCCVPVRGFAAGRSLVHPDGSYRSRQGLGTLRAHTRPSGRRLFVAGRGWVPSGRALVHPDGGWRACACSLWPGRAGRPPGRVVVRLTFSFGRFLLCLAPSGLGLPPSLSLPLPFLVALALCFAGSSRFPAAWLFVRSRLVCVPRLAAGCSLVVSPPPLSLFVSRGFRRSCLVLWCCCCFFFVFFLLLPPCAPPVSGFLWFPAPGALGLGAVRCLLCWPSASRLSVRVSLFRAFRLAGRCPPPPFCLAVFVAPAWCLGVVVFFFFFLLSLCAPVVSGFLWFPAPGALGLGAVRCLLCWPSASRLSVCLSLFRAFRLAGRWPPPPPFVSRFSSLPLGAVCRVLCVPGCGAAPRCCALCPPVLCCPVLCCARWVPLLVAPCSLALAVALGPVLCGAVFCGVAPCCVCFVVARWCALLFTALLCSVCVPGCCAVRSLSSPLCAVLCFAVPLRSRCAVRVVRAAAGAWCCGVPWCGAGSGGPWLSAGGVFRCRCRCLAAVSVSLWLVWFAVVPCFPVSCSLVLCCRVVPCCCALLSCCGAVGACFTLLWAVVLRCVVLVVGCAVFCPVVVSACCGALFLVLCVPCLLRSVRCGALLCWLWCPASLCCGAVLALAPVSSALLLPVWLYLLEKPPQNFVKYLFFLFFCFFFCF